MNSTRLAIATADGISVADHLAHSTAFVVFELENNAVVSRSIRARATDRCGNHASFVEMLAGCGNVICGGIGPGAWHSLVAQGIQPIVLANTMPVEEALAGYVAGSLETTEDRICLCH